VLPPVEYEIAKRQNTTPCSAAAVDNLPHFFEPSPTNAGNVYLDMQKPVIEQLQNTGLNKRFAISIFHNPDIKKPRLFPTKLQAICQTNAHLLIDILREYHV